MANINKIRVSGTTYNIEDTNATKTAEVSQAQYDALVAAGTVDSNTFYIITDAEYFDPSNYYTSAQTQSAITQSVSGKADTSAVTSVSDSLTAHTANTTVHVTAQDKTNWNAKSDFSGDYNDLTNKPTIPTVPTNVSDFTNDAGYITSDDISGKTNQSDFTAHTANTTVHVTASEKSTWNSKSDFSGNYNDLSNKPTIPSKTSDLTNDSNFATTGEVQTMIDESVSGKVNISDNNVSAFSDFKVALESGKDYTSDNISTFYLGTKKTTGSGTNDLVTITTTDVNYPTITINCGYISGNIIQVRTTSGITSSVENGIAQITLTGGSLVTVDAASNGGVVFLYKQYTSGQTADVVEDTVYDALKELSNNKLDYIYKDETINSKKTFLWGASGSDKPIIFKQTNNSAKLGFICQNSASTNNEIATFEFRPDTYTDSSSVKHPLLYFGHYRNNATANAGVPQTMVGFRQYDQLNAAAYHYLMPLPAEAKTPFSLTTSFKNYFAPLGFKVNTGGTIVTTDKTGLVDLSSYIGGGGSDINVVQTTGTSTTDVMSQNAVTTQLNNKLAKVNYSDKSWAGSGITSVDFSKDSSNYEVITFVGSINYKPILTGSDYTKVHNFSLVETSAITTSVTSSSTDAQVPSAKAVNDKLGGLSIVKMSQSEYDSLSTKDNSILYVIVN